MVFEGILVEVLNTFLGDYIENLDKDQLSVAVWTGNVELRALKLKDSLLDDLNYPIKTAFGYLGKLHVDIPWKHLYTHPIVITIEDALLLAVPNDEAEYDAEKAAQRRWEQKKRQLKHLELVGGETEQTTADDVKAKQPVKATKMSFKEKLIAKLVNNIQVELKNVHVRYEGQSKEKKDAFCFGATLGGLLFKTTDEKFNVKTLDDATQLIYKLLKLEYLTVYCSPRESTLFSTEKEKQGTLTAFQDYFISSKEDSSAVQAFHVLEPLFFTSKLAMNPQPEAGDSDFTEPKVTLDAGLEAIKVRLSRSQYAGILEFLESMEGLNMKSRYRGLVAPEMPITKKNAAAWWWHAVDATVEVDIRPRFRQWSWQHIKEHRALLKQYSAAYSKKLNSSSGTLSAGEEKELEEMEKQLDVFNILLARHQAQFDVAVDRKKPSWWSWLTGKGEDSGEESADEGDIRQRLKKALNEEEKQKLHTALGYSEESGDSSNPNFPPTYVAFRLLWDLDKASVSLVDDGKDGSSVADVATVSLNSFSGRFEQRPTADGLYLKTEVRDIIVTGKANKEGKLAVIAKPDAAQEGQEDIGWMRLLYESNPVDSEAGVRLHLFVNPVQIKYDADTVNAIVQFFKPPEAIALRQLQAQAVLALESLRESTVAKVRDILSNHRYTDFNVDLKAPYFVLLEHGVDEREASSLVVDLGSIKLVSLTKGGANINPDIASLQDLKDQSYEKYQLEFKDLQIIFAQKGDDWQAARHGQNNQIKILQPVTCTLQLWNCLIRNHPMLPLGIVLGELPHITVDISEERLLALLKLLLTIPLPETNYTGDLEFSEKARDIVREYRDMKVVQTLYAMKLPDDDLGGLDITILSLSLTIQEMSISILDKRQADHPICRIAAQKFTQDVAMKASEMSCISRLSEFFIEYKPKQTQQPVKLIQAHRGNSQDKEEVLRLTFTSVSSLTPDFETKHQCTLSRLDAVFSGLEVNVDQTALLDIADFIDTLRTEVTAVVEETRTEGPRLLSAYFSSGNSEETQLPLDETDKKDQLVQVSTDVTATPADEGFVSEDKLVQFALHAVGQVVLITLADTRGVLCRSVIEGLDVGFSQKKSAIMVETKLKSISLENPDPKALYPMILRTTVSKELLYVQAVIRQEPLEIQRQRGLFSQEFEVRLGSIEFVFLNVFIMDITRYATQLQGIFARFSGVAQAATDKTKQAAVDVYEQAARIKLEVDVKAPVIILPQHSQSRNALMFDLGSLRIANQIEGGDQQSNRGGDEALIDNVTLSISSITFDRIEDYDPATGPKQSFNLINQPQPTVIQVKRNLNFKTDKSRSEIEAQAKVPSLEFSLSNVDYQVILDTLTQNFAEGVEAEPEGGQGAPMTPPNSPPPKPALSAVKEEPEREKDLEEPSSSTGIQPLKEPAPLLSRSSLGEDEVEFKDAVEDPSQLASKSESSTVVDALHRPPSQGPPEANGTPRFKLAFDLDSLLASLYWINRPKSHNRPLAAPPLDTEKLAIFELNGLHLDAAVDEDLAVTGTCHLADVTLQDCRGNYEKRISRLLYLRNAEEDRHLLQVTASIEQNGSQNFEVKVAPFEILVIVDFFIEVSEFFTVKTDTADAKDAKDAKAIQSQKTPLKEKAIATTRQAEKQRASPAAEVKSERTIVVSVLVDSPTILLIEDPKNLDSKMLLLSTNLRLNMGMVEGSQSFQASAENFRMFATHYKSRSANPQRILDPVDVALQYKHAAQSGQHVGLTVTDVVISITPSVIKLLTTTMAGLGNLNWSDELPEHPVGVYMDLWDAKPVDADHWFLQPPDENQSDDKILTALEQTEKTPPKQLYEGDMFMFDLPSVMVVVEVGEVNRVIPAFLLEMRAFGTVRDWTTRLQAKGILFVELGYYNPHHDTWEPVIEPIDDGKEERPWEVAVEIVRNDISITELRRAAKQGMNLQRRFSTLSVDTLASPVSSDIIPDAMGTDVMQESAALQVTLKATSPLQLTVTRTGVELIKNAINNFLEAANKDLDLAEATSSAPYILQNHLGIDVKLQVVSPLQFGEVDLTTDTDSDGIIQVKSGASREVFVSSKLRKIRKNALHQSTVEQPLTARLIVAGRSLELSLLKAERRFFFIQNSEDVQKPFRLIVDIVAETSYKVIHLQSSMTVTSFLLMPMELQGGFASVDHIGVVDPNQTVFMPIRSVQFDEKAVLMCRPAHSDLYQQSEKIPIGQILRMDAEEKSFLLQCDPIKLGKDPTLYFILFCRVLHLKYENTQKFTPNSVEYTVFLRSVITIANVLPYDMSVGYIDAQETPLFREEKMAADVSIEDNHVPIETGTSRPLYTVHPAKHKLVLRLKNYMDVDWEGAILLSALKEEFTPVVLASRPSSQLEPNSGPDQHDTVVIGLRMLKEDGTMFLTIYSPFWMLNKTGLLLGYKKPEREHRADFVQPLLYATSTSHLQEKRKIAMRVEGSEWSKKFSPDAVSSNGLLICQTSGHEGRRAYEIGMQIRASSTVMTKLVVFSPYYVLSNVSEKVAIEVREDHPEAKWILIETKTTLPFWPLYNEVHSEKEKDEKKDKDKEEGHEVSGPPANRLVCRVAGTQEESAPFAYSVLQANLLAVNNKYGGVYVETQVSECNAITTLQPFYPGRQTNKLINLSRFPVYYRQKGDLQYQGLRSDMERMFTYPLPFADKKIEWFIRDDNLMETQLDQDDSGLVNVETDTVYWVSFYHENERTLLFTEDVEMALRVQQAVELEPTSLELLASIESIGLSLVNNVSKHEVLYAGIVSGGPTWQWRKLTGNSKRFHTFKGKDARLLEMTFQKYKSNVEAELHVDGLTQIEHSDMEVDFGSMMMTKPHRRQLQRIYEDGFWMRAKTSASQYQVHLKLEKVQIDNPNPLSQYPVVLVPVPLPESVGPKPFFEASLIVRQTQHSKNPQYKLIEALLQEVEISVDQGLINSIVAIIQPEQENGFVARQKMLEGFHKKDGEELRRTLAETVASNTGTEEPILFDHLVIHPLKLHISFSMTGAENDAQSPLAMSSEFLSLFMKTIGVAASEVNDVLIRLAIFERLHKTFTNNQIAQQMQSHYTSQLLKQIYTIALGLDIIGNPFGLIRGIGSGVRDLFYEPYEGAVEGPDEFLSGLGSGVQSLVGKSVGGVLGTASKITGSVGRAMATVSFDEKFIRNRQREKNRTPTDLPGALAQSTKTLGLGIVQGVTGVVKQPMEGARQEGALGFFKGIGKGLLGVVVRPSVGIIDSVTGAIEGVRRAGTGEVDQLRIRPTRHISPDGVVRPYNLHQAEGAYVFRDIQNKELRDDEYVTHLVTTRERSHILLLTTNRVIYLERGEVLQSRFTTEWMYSWDHFLAPPSMSEKGIMFPVFEPQEKGLKEILHLERKDKPRYVFVEDADSGEWFIRKVKSVMESMREK